MGSTMGTHSWLICSWDLPL